MGKTAWPPCGAAPQESLCPGEGAGVPEGGLLLCRAFLTHYLIPRLRRCNFSALCDSGVVRVDRLIFEQEDFCISASA